MPVLGVVGLARAFPSWWPAVAAPAAALLVLVVGFVAPVVLEPIFNRFTPLDDVPLASALRALAMRAGVPVRDVLVADASRRTRKVNAYVSGIGATRRVVLYDTLLREVPQRELEVVVAHELGHRRARHVAKGTVLAMLGAAMGTLVIWALLPDPQDPAAAPLILLDLGGARAGRSPVRGGTLAPVGASCRPLLARPDRRPRRVPCAPPEARDHEPR